MNTDACRNGICLLAEVMELRRRGVLLRLTTAGPDRVLNIECHRLETHHGNSYLGLLGVIIAKRLVHCHQHVRSHSCEYFD